MSWPKPLAQPVRLCPAKGLVKVEHRWDQPGWFVTCTEHGTIAAGLDMADASRCAAAHEAGTDGPGLHR